MNKWLAKKLRHARRSFLPDILVLNMRKIRFAANQLVRGTVAIPVLRSSSANMTFIIPSPSGRQKLYEIDTDPEVYRRAYALFAGGLFPRILDMGPPFVRAEWIRGGLLSNFSSIDEAQALGQILAEIHSRAPKECPTHFGHLERLKSRFNENLSGLDFAQLRRANGLLESIEDEYAKLAPSLPASCVHPDVIASNVVVRDGDYVVIDNEFFSAGTGKEFDVINSMYSLAPEVRDAFLSAYGKDAPLEHFHLHRRFWEDLHKFKRLSRAMRFRNRRLIAEILATSP